MHDTGMLLLTKPRVNDLEQVIFNEYISIEWQRFDCPSSLQFYN